MTLNEHLANLSDDELQRLALFACGLALGLALFVLARAILEEWVISADLADRERIREILREMLAKRRDSEPQESPPAIRAYRSTTQNAAAADVDETRRTREQSAANSTHGNTTSNQLDAGKFSPADFSGESPRCLPD